VGGGVNVDSASGVRQDKKNLRRFEVMQK